VWNKPQLKKLTRYIARLHRAKGSCTCAKPGAGADAGSEQLTTTEFHIEPRAQG